MPNTRAHFWPDDVSKIGSFPLRLGQLSEHGSDT